MDVFLALKQQEIEKEAARQAKKEQLTNERCGQCSRARTLTVGRVGGRGGPQGLGTPKRWARRRAASNAWSLCQGALWAAPAPAMTQEYSLELGGRERVR